VNPQQDYRMPDSQEVQKIAKAVKESITYMLKNMELKNND
jgi:hypothetical protein